MEKKMLWVFTIVLIVGLSNALLPEGVCSVPAKSRENCGYPGIGEIECSQKNCCFDSNVMGVPWCFKPDFADASEQCAVQVSAREDCGYPGISTEECSNRGCCFDSSIPNVIWCFFPNNDPECF
uniref:trefoil factor 3-like n=1 Tax=Euleptes europaea TaxID=460621 RepID=UPI00253FF0CA|nr:trefoil factor 3-like [Euleptes europaea]